MESKSEKKKISSESLAFEYQETQKERTEKADGKKSSIQNFQKISWNSWTRIARWKEPTRYIAQGMKTDPHQGIASCNFKTPT